MFMFLLCLGVILGGAKGLTYWFCVQGSLLLMPEIGSGVCKENLFMRLSPALSLHFEKHFDDL